MTASMPLASGPPRSGSAHGGGTANFMSLEIYSHPAGVSEATVFNDVSTKESLVFDGMLVDHTDLRDLSDGAF